MRDALLIIPADIREAVRALPNKERQAILAAYRQHSDRRGGRGVVRLLPKKSKWPTCCPH